MNIRDHGFEVHSNFITRDVVNTIIQEIDSLGFNTPKHGIRNADKKLKSIKNLTTSTYLLKKAKQFVQGRPKVVRVIVFDKTPDKNWLVTWHQDKTIAVDTKENIAGWGPWTLKDGINHVQPCVNVLENMVTFRIHLDHADEENGCLKVIPKSHRLGILNKNELNHTVSIGEAYSCNAHSGDLLVMRPLLLHSSSKASSPTHRRIVHIEYSCFELPAGLKWG